MLKTGSAEGLMLLEARAPKAPQQGSSSFAEDLNGQMKGLDKSNSEAQRGETERSQAVEANRTEDSGQSEKRRAADDDELDESSREDREREQSEKRRAADDDELDESSREDRDPEESGDHEEGTGRAASPADPSEEEADGKSLPPVDGLMAQAWMATAERRRSAGQTSGRSSEPGGELVRDRKNSERGLPHFARELVTKQNSDAESDKSISGTRGLKSSDSFFDLLSAGRRMLVDGKAKELPFQNLSGRASLGSMVGTMGSETSLIASPVGGVPAQPLSGGAGAIASINVPVQQQGWDQALSEKVVWMTRQNLNQAQVQLNPRHLGPIELKVMVTNDQVNVQFNVQNPVTREAVEAAMPRLREMLSDSGLNLAQSDVSDHPKGGQGEADGDGESADGRGSGPLAGTAEGEEIDGAVVRETALGDLGVVDYFA